MSDNIPLRIKIIISTALSIVIVGSILTLSNLHSMNELIVLAERQELRSYVRNVSNAIASETRLGEALSALVANIPLVQRKFAEGDRDALANLLLPTYPVLAHDYGVSQFQFHLPPATSFLRLHKPEKFGYDLSSFRHTVTHTNEIKKPTRGLESGVAGLGLRGMVPVFNEGQHIGSVEFGMNFGPPFFDAFKKKYGVEVALHIHQDEGHFKTFASTLGEQSLLSNDQLKQAFAGNSQLIYKNIQGISHAVNAELVEDFSGHPIGVIEIAMNRSAYQNALDHSKTKSLWIGILALAVGVVLSFITANSLVRRISSLIDSVNHIAEGDLTITIQNEGTDEIGQLVQAAAQMKQQLCDIESQVHQNADSVYSAAQQISSEVGGQAATSSELSASIAEITSTMEELSASSSQISEHANAVVDIANHTLRSSQQSSDSVQAILERMADIQEDNKSSLHEIVELGSRSKEISKIMDIINAVADQTKLIAFNAALEASSAGDAGRRFGVVAAEIRRLADNVTESTSEIESKISEIQESISRLVITSEKGSEGITQGMAESQETVEHLRELVVSADETLTSAQQISLSTQQQKTASNQVVVALREIMTATSHTKEAIEHISGVSQNMAQLSANLKALVERFKIS